NAWQRHVTIAVKWYFALVEGRQGFGLGAGTDPAHLPFENIEDLRQLVEPVPAQGPTDPGDPRIAVICDRCKALVRDGPIVHGSELVHGDEPAGMTDPRLTKEDWALAGEADSERDGAHDRQSGGGEDYCGH